MIIRHLSFLKSVLIHSITAFGGPQAHIGMMQRTFVQLRRDITDTELLDINALCSILPGASSTQVLTLIGYKRGGLLLATLTLLIWTFPACLLMALLSFLVTNIPNKSITNTLFIFIQPMAIGFLLYAAYNSIKVVKRNTITIAIVILSSVAIFVLFKYPYIFPLVIIVSGVVTNLSSKRIPQVTLQPKKIKLRNLWIFVSILIFSGFISELSRNNNWETNTRRPINLFENTYRMGSIVFGGGQVLIPMLESQFCKRVEQRNFNLKNPNAIVINKRDFYTGAGIVRAIPGPVFSIAAYTGGLAMSNNGFWWQFFGCIIGAVAIFLPSSLLVLFFYPVWHNIKKYAIIYRALEGIHAAVVGIMLGSSIYICYDATTLPSNNLLVTFCTIISTFILLSFTKLQTPIIVLIYLLLGVLYPFFI